MRSYLHVRTRCALFRASALVFAGSVIAGCSNEATRFEDALVTNSTLTTNQQDILKKRTARHQAYPGDEDQSRIRVVKPPVERGAPAPIAPAVERAPLGAAKVQKPRIKVVKPAKVAQAAQTSGKAAPVILPAKKTIKNPLRIAGTDPIQTGSVSRSAKPAVEAQRKAQRQGATTAKKVDGKRNGWTKAGGTWVTMRSGETLYNLSRRYGVPVSAITAANNLKDPNSVPADARILIPTYNFADSAPVSAPDSNPITAASRSSRGYAGQLRNGRIATPKSRATPPEPSKTASVKETSVSTDGLKDGAGAYTVVSGDTLYGIAGRFGTTAAAIRAANGMSSSTVRLGQKLVIPGKVAQTVVAKVDPQVTGSIPTSDTSPKARTQKLVQNPPAASQKETIAKPVKPQKLASANTASFRWPVQGRVISKFGERVRGNTNDGIDISVPVGTSVRASDAGTVIYSGSELQDFGKLVLISHSNGWVTAYGHASQNLVKRGDKVRRGQVIAKSGKTGNATVPKLHFELRRHSNPVNPLRYLK